MHQLALNMHQKGYRVSGSDDEIFEPALGNLQAAGLLPPALGWFPEKIYPGLDGVILGMHSRRDNPELLRSLELDIPVYSYPGFIYRESLQKKRVVIAGSHGKTTITSMIMHALKHTGADFDYLVGASLAGFPASVRISQAPLLVCEGDEYPASIQEPRSKFLLLAPHLAVISGIAWDHINIFPTFGSYLNSFREFLRVIQPGGTLIYNRTDPQLEQLIEACPRRDLHIIPYELPEFEKKVATTWVTLGLARTPLQVFGSHNLLNLSAAYQLGRQLDISDEAFCGAMADFRGASKRLEVFASGDSAVMILDFAHAPSKVRASLQAVKEQFPGRYLLAVLELHTFSSLNRDFLDQYRGALDPADTAVVFFSRHALALKQLPPLDPSMIREAFGRSDLQVFSDREQLQRFLDEQSLEQSCLLMMSSGDFEGLDLKRISNRLPKKTDIYPK